MFRYILPVGAALAMVLSQAQTAQAGQSHNQQSQSSQANNTSNNNRQSNTNSYNHNKDSGSQNNDRQNMRSNASRDIGSVLNEVNQARRDVKSQNRQQALHEVNTALNTLQNTRNSNQRYIPLYTEVDEYSVMGPIMASRNGNRINSGTSNNSATNNSRASNSGNANGKQGQSANGSERPVAVQDVAGQFTSVVVDKQMIQTHLQKAKQALQNSDYKAADEALAAAQDSVDVASVASDLPLLRARENLVLAKAAANSGDYQEARSALKSACSALRNYASTNSAHAQDAKHLESQINNYQMSSDHSNASSQIQSWWDETAGWNGTSNSGQHMASNSSK